MWINTIIVVYPVNFNIFNIIQTHVLHVLWIIDNHYNIYNYVNDSLPCLMNQTNMHCSMICQWMSHFHTTTKKNVRKSLLSKLSWLLSHHDHNFLSTIITQVSSNIIIIHEQKLVFTSNIIILMDNPIIKSL